MFKTVVLGRALFQIVTSITPKPLADVASKVELMPNVLGEIPPCPVTVMAFPLITAVPPVAGF
jgi:hypothetical protein